MVVEVTSVFILLFKDDLLLSKDDYIHTSDFSTVTYLHSTQNKAYCEWKKTKSAVINSSLKYKSSPQHVIYPEFNQHFQVFAYSLSSKFYLACGNCE